MVTEEERAHSQQWQSSVSPMPGCAPSLLSTQSLSYKPSPHISIIDSYPPCSENHESSLEWDIKAQKLMNHITCLWFTWT